MLQVMPRPHRSATQSPRAPRLFTLRATKRDPTTTTCLGEKGDRTGVLNVIAERQTLGRRGSAAPWALVAPRCPDGIDHTRENQSQNPPHVVVQIDMGIRDKQQEAKQPRPTESNDHPLSRTLKSVQLGGGQPPLPLWLIYEVHICRRY